MIDTGLTHRFVTGGDGAPPPGQLMRSFVAERMAIRRHQVALAITAG